MKHKKRGFGNVVKFAETKGFYMILGLCVVAVGVAGYLLFFRDGEAPEKNPQEQVLQQQPVQIPSQPETPEKEEPDDVLEAPGSHGKEEPEEPEEPETPKTPEEVPAEQTGRPVSVPETTYTPPVSGEVLRPFSGKQLVYDETMGDWRTHNGTDFACSADEAVCAIASGTVTGAEEKGIQGLCVTVDHGNGKVSVYAGLASAGVKKGDSVKQGQTIGTCAGNLVAESAQPPHLHLEVLEDGAYLDPMSLLDK